MIIGGNNTGDQKAFNLPLNSQDYLSNQKTANKTPFKIVKDGEISEPAFDFNQSIKWNRMIILKL